MAKKSTLRSGIVGSGFAATLHLESIKKVYGTNVDLIGVFSPTKKNAQEFSEKNNIKLYNSLETLLDDVDVVHICASPAAHERIVVAALNCNVHPIVEKPLTGFFGDSVPEFHISNISKELALKGAIESVERILEAEALSSAKIMYAENWVYAPTIQKEREIIEKTGAQILWMHGEEAHSGSHSKAYGYWRLNGGGSLIGKGVHPLTTALYLKRIEGQSRHGQPIRPATVSARTHEITRLTTFDDRGYIRTEYNDVEDFSAMHLVFEDGTIADIFASEIVMGGVHNWIEIVANNHRAICNINPNSAMHTYNPKESQFNNIYVVEKIGTKQGWAPIAPDEDHFTGFPQEIEAFYRSVVTGEKPESDSRLAADTICVVYSAYLSAERKGMEVPIKLC